MFEQSQALTNREKSTKKSDYSTVARITFHIKHWKVNELQRE